MTSHEGTLVTRPPLFDGMNFAFWKVRMRTYLMALGVDVWDVVETGYIKLAMLSVITPRNPLWLQTKGAW